MWRQYTANSQHTLSKYGTGSDAVVAVYVRGKNAVQVGCVNEAPLDDAVAIAYLPLAASAKLQTASPAMQLHGLQADVWCSCLAALQTVARDNLRCKRCCDEYLEQRVRRREAV